MVFLQAVFGFEGYSEPTKQRSITVEQLHRVVSFAEVHCSFLEDTHSKEKLRINRVNLYHIKDLCIKPATSEYNSAFVELIRASW